MDYLLVHLIALKFSNFLAQPPVNQEKSKESSPVDLNYVKNMKFQREFNVTRQNQMRATGKQLSASEIDTTRQKYNIGTDFFHNGNCFTSFKTGYTESGVPLKNLKTELKLILKETLLVSCQMTFRKVKNRITYFKLTGYCTPGVKQELKKYVHFRNMVLVITYANEADEAKANLAQKRFSEFNPPNQWLILFSNVAEEPYHHDFIFRPVSGKLRLETRQKLKNVTSTQEETLSNVCRETTEIQKLVARMGNQDAHVPRTTSDVTKKIKSEEKLKNRQHPCPMIDLQIKKMIQIRNKTEFIRFCETETYTHKKKNPSVEFVVELMHYKAFQLIMQNKDFTVSCDATGSTIANTVCPFCKVKHANQRIFVYFLIARFGNNENGAVTVPIFIRISSMHNYSKILESFERFAKLVNPIPFNIFITDWALAVVHAACEAFNKIDLVEYNNKMFRGEGVTVYIASCVAHFVKNVVGNVKKLGEKAREEAKNNKSETTLEDPLPTQLKNFIILTFCNIVKQRSNQGIFQIIRAALVIMSYPDECDAVVSAWSVLESILKSQKANVPYLLTSVANLVEDLKANGAQVNDKNMEESCKDENLDEYNGSKETRIVDQLLYYQEYKKIEQQVDKEVQQFLSDKDAIERPKNSYFDKYRISRQMIANKIGYVGNWGMVGYGKISENRLSNAPVEAFHGHVKGNMFPSLPVSLDYFIEKMESSIDYRAQMALDGRMLKATFGRKRKGTPQSEPKSKKPKKFTYLDAKLTKKSVTQIPKRPKSSVITKMNELDETQLDKHNKYEEWDRKRKRSRTPSPTQHIKHFKVESTTPLCQPHNSNSIKPAARKNLTPILEKSIENLPQNQSTEIVHIPYNTPPKENVEITMPTVATRLRPLQLDPQNHLVQDKGYYSLSDIYLRRSHGNDYLTTLSKIDYDELIEPFKWVDGAVIDYTIKALCDMQKTPRNLHFIRITKTKNFFGDTFNPVTPLETSDLEALNSNDAFLVCPRHVNGNHFALFAIDTKFQKFFYLDGMYGLPSTMTLQFLDKYVVNRIRSFRSLMNQPPLNEVSERWTIQEVDLAPQKDNDNCGPLLINFTRRLLASFDEKGNIPQQPEGFSGVGRFRWHNPHDNEDLKRIRQQASELLKKPALLPDQLLFCPESSSFHAHRSRRYKNLDDAKKNTYQCSACDKFIHIECFKTQEFLEKHKKVICTHCYMFFSGEKAEQIEREKAQKIGP